MTTDREDYGVSLIQEESDRRVERGQRVLVWATVNAPTNAREPSGNWWVQLDGHSGLVAVPESAILRPDEQSAPAKGQTYEEGFSDGYAAAQEESEMANN